MQWLIPAVPWRVAALIATLPPFGGPAAAGPLADAAKANPVPLMIDRAGDFDSGKLLQSLSGVAAATIKTAGRFTWNVARGEIVNPVGDVVASVTEGDLEAQLAWVQGVVDKWTALRALEPQAATHRLTTRLDPGDDVHHQGARVTLIVEDNSHPYFTLINLASDGTVNFLYPIDDGKTRDSPTIPLGGPYKLELTVSPPFGADHFLAIASAAPLTGLHTELKDIDGKPEAGRLLDLLDTYLRGQDWQIGLHAVFSAR